jgi:rubrerythrin
MSLIPTYFCDHCAHAFSTPERANTMHYSYSGAYYAAMQNPERCPKCGNPDFELLIPEKEETHEEVL